MYDFCVPNRGVKSFADLVHFVAQRLGIPDKVRDVMIQSRPSAHEPVPDHMVKQELHDLAKALPCIAVTSKGYALYRAGPPQPLGGINKDYLMKTGTYWWPLTIGNGHKMDTLEEANAMGQAMLTMLSRVNAKWAYDALTNDIPSQDLMFGSAAWAECAFPVIQLGSHKYAAALMATSIPNDIEIRPPWPSFVIEMPSNLLYTQDPGTGRDEPLEIIHVVTYGDKWSIYAHSRTMNLHRTRWLVEDMVEDRDPQVITEGSVMDDRDNRTILLLTRLVLSACLAMSDPTNVKQVGKHAKASPPKSARGTPEPPTTRAFRIGKPIELDVRPALQAFLRGERRSSPTVQGVVRGHWRNQAVGAGWSQHRVRWIEPYWKGPEDAAIAIRPHVIGKPKEP